MLETPSAAANLPNSSTDTYKCLLYQALQRCRRRHLPWSHLEDTQYQASRHQLLSSTMGA